MVSLKHEHEEKEHLIYGSQASKVKNFKFLRDCTVLSFSPSLQYLAFKVGVILDELIHYIKTSQVTLVVKNLPANTGDVRGVGQTLGREIPGRGHGNLLQYSCQENPLAGYCP